MWGGVIVPMVTLAVSGSAVLIGNTVHWMEYQGRCDEEKIAKALAKNNRKKNETSDLIVKPDVSLSD